MITSDATIWSITLGA